MLPSPYGDCRQAENYTFQRCMTKCMATFLLSKCGCRGFEMEGINLQNKSDRFNIFYIICLYATVFIYWVRRSRVVTFAAIRLRGPGFKPRPVQKFENRFLIHSQPSRCEGVSPVQSEAIRRRYIKPEYLSYSICCSLVFNRMQ